MQNMEFLEIRRKANNYCHHSNRKLNRDFSISVTKTLCEKCPNTELFLVRIFLYSDNFHVVRGIFLN